MLSNLFSGRLFSRSGLFVFALLPLWEVNALSAQALPDGVERVIFQSEEYQKPVELALPALASDADLSAFRNAVARGGGMLSPVAPQPQIELSDARVRLACALRLVVLERVRSREGQTFHYALASPELAKFAPGQRSGVTASLLGLNGIPAAVRVLKSIDYQNRYRANPMGMGERDLFAITFSYTLKSVIADFTPPSTVFKGKATAQQDPEDGEWKLEKLSLSDEGSRELYKSLPSSSLACEVRNGVSPNAVPTESRAVSVPTKAEGVATCGASRGAEPISSSQDLRGAWAGTLLQGAQRYSVRIEFEVEQDGRLNGSVSYPGLNCSGFLKGAANVATDGVRATATETIGLADRVRCVSGSQLAITSLKDGTGLLARWLGRTGAVEASGTLCRP